MSVRRLRSIDIFRGACMAWMVLNHLIDWWLKIEYSWLHTITIMIIDPIGASGFLFISGVSLAISYRSRLTRVKESKEYNYRMVRNSYLFRALFIFIIAILYNIPTAIVLKDPSMIWTWFVLLTAAVSIFFAWPLLKTNKFFRIFIAVIILTIHFIIISYLLPFQGESNTFGLLFHILYNDIYQDPILIFFPFFIIGTVIGDLIYETLYINKVDLHNSKFKKHFLIPIIVVGISLIIVGIFIKFPTFLIRESMSWVIYSVGIDLSFLSILLMIEKFNIFKTKRSYKLIFYFSYYSLTIYLGHNILYFLFLNQLDLISIWIFAALSFFSIGFILRGIYKKYGQKASLKVQIGIFSQKLTENIEARKEKRKSKT
ncbi:MAG: heparan-alpha-glucosaminide N-acetyltransferase domain-containing protein [Promethearchaeota archaeon]|jgi:hypothetical protein